MDLKIIDKCFTEQSSNLIIDLAGNRIPARSVIFCKKRAFIIMVNGDIIKFIGEEVDAIHQADDNDQLLWDSG